MIVVFPFSARDVVLARKLALWMVELGPYPGHRAMVVKDSRINDNHEVAETLRKCFDSVQEVVYPDDGRNEWPFSANRMFNRAAKEIEYSARPEPWLWLEPDVVPQPTDKPNWLERLLAEAKIAWAKNKAFVGAEVNVPDVPLHMSGVGIYPAQISQFAYEAPMASEVAWDVAAAHQIVPQAHFTDLIVHNWKHEPIDTKSKLENLRGQHPNMILFHSDKSGAMIDLLRAEMTGAEPAQKVEEIGPVEVKGLKATTFPDIPVHHYQIGATDLFIKTYPEDYEWLSYCLRSISKFASGFRLVHIVSDDVLTSAVGSLPKSTSVHILSSQPDGYLWQQVIKLDADKRSDAEWIVYLDSDTIFTKPVTPEILIGLPWMMTPYSDKMGKEKVWRSVTEQFLKAPVEFEFMRRHPFVVPSWLLKSIKEYCVLAHGITLDQWVLRCAPRHFSEFNALGAFAYYHHPEKFKWLNTAEVLPEKWPILYVDQRWSKGGLTPEIKASFDEILGGGSEKEEVGKLTGETGPSPIPSVPAKPEKFQEKAGGSPSGIHQTKEGYWVLDGDNFISKWVEEEHRLDHDRWLMDRILPLVKPGDLVVEVGAYIGDHTRAFLDNGCRVLAIEPNPKANQCLQKNCPEAQISHIALWHEPARLEFEVTQADNPGAWFVQEHFNGSPVMADTLDSFGIRPELIVIDAEGSELFVLQGAKETIQKCRPILIIEMNAGAMKRYGYDQRSIHDWLRNEGYDWAPIQPLNVPDPPQYDIVCRPKRAVLEPELKRPLVSKKIEIRNNGQWTNREAALNRIEELVKELATYCGAPAHTAIVRRAVCGAGVFPDKVIRFLQKQHKK